MHIRLLNALFTLGLLSCSQARAQDPGYRSIGSGCPGAFGSPILTAKASAVPILGLTFRSQVHDSSQAAAIGILGLSTRDWLGFALPLHLAVIGMPGCYLHTSIRRSIPLSPGKTRSTWALELPMDPAWIGRSFYQQVLVFDGSGPGTGAVMSNANQGTIAAPQQAPFAKIAFPPPVSWTDAESILVRGHAYDPDTVDLIRVNDKPASSQDGFANWQLRVPLAKTEGKIRISTRDLLGKIDSLADIASIREPSPRLGLPVGISIDPLRAKAYVADTALRALVEVDLQNSSSRILSDSENGLGPDFATPRALSSRGNRALVIDRGLDALIEIDLESGDRRLVSDANRGDGPLLQEPRTLVQDEERAYVIDRLRRAVLVVDLATGDRQILSGPDVGMGPGYSSPEGIAIYGDRLLVADTVSLAFPSRGRLLAVDPDTGDRQVLADSSQSSEAKLLAPIAMALQANRIYILQVGYSARFVPEQLQVIQIHLPSTARKVLSGMELGSGPFLEGSLGIAASAELLLVSNPESGLLIAIDPMTGERVVLSN